MIRASYVIPVFDAALCCALKSRGRLEQPMYTNGGRLFGDRQAADVPASDYEYECMQCNGMIVRINMVGLWTAFLV